MKETYNQLKTILKSYKEENKNHVLALYTLKNEHEKLCQAVALALGLLYLDEEKNLNIINVLERGIE